MYIWMGRRDGSKKVRNKSSRHRAKLKAKNRRRINGMQGRKLRTRLAKTKQR